jgi:hypothetical protein
MNLADAAQNVLPLSVADGINMAQKRIKKTFFKIPLYFSPQMADKTSLSVTGRTTTS